MDLEVFGDLIIPAAQDSPKHIWNILSDERGDQCIQAILSRIKNISDFLSAAEVCKRFQKNAKICFPAHHQVLNINDQQALFPDRGGLPLKRALKFLNLFGEKVRSIQWDYPSKLSVIIRLERLLEWGHANVDESLQILRPIENDFVRDDIHSHQALNIIAKYCDKTLIDLKIGDHHVNFNTLSQFNALETLEFDHVYVKSSSLDSTSFSASNEQKSLTKLKSWKLKLVFTNNDMWPWLTQSFPNLTDIEFDSIIELTFYVVVEFQRLNPQLEKFTVTHCKFITTLLMEGISERTPHLITLNDPEFYSEVDAHNLLQPMLPEQVTQRNIADLGQLWDLKSYRFPGRLIIMDDIVNLFVENNIPIERLHFVFFPPNNDFLVDNLARIPTLKTIIFSTPILSSQAIQLVEKLPGLQQLCIEHRSNITLDDIKRILSLGTNLNTLKLCVFDIFLSFVDYNSILDLVKGRVQVELYHSPNSMVVVDENTLNTNRKWLNIQGYDALESLQPTDARREKFTLFVL